MMERVSVEIQLPSLLASVLKKGEMEIEAGTLREALQVIAKEHPKLAVHLFEETGEFRPHVLCFHNGTNTRWLDNLDVPIQRGDQLLFMQAVSGG